MVESNMEAQGIDARRVVMVVAYPGDETLFGGGHILSTTTWKWRVVSMFESSRPALGNRFFEALERLGATGEMLGFSSSDAPKVEPLSESLASALIESDPVNLIITHSPKGEHERLPGRDRVGRIVARLWQKGAIQVPRLWLFAYDESPTGHLYASDTSDRSVCLPSDVLAMKQDILMNVYGFAPDSFAVRACPTEEAFHCFCNGDALKTWIRDRGSKTRNPT
jgi:hypothetical protein